MAPGKGKCSAPSKKVETKKKEKIIEDKTFGLKNKKGAKQQKFIQQVQKQVKSGGIHPTKPVEAVKKKEEKADELNQIFKPVQVQKIEKGADPKSVLCVFFKFGQCTKGNKCKFSHDLDIERKAEKRSLYVDMRDDGEETEDKMDSWTEEKLKEVVEKKHGEANKKTPTTNIICKYFIEAVENSKYGWFWACPNGPTCIYRHALPPGFVLKKDKKQEEKVDVVSLEELIEKERQALNSSNSAKLTLETFLQWKKQKLKEKKVAQEKEDEKKRVNFKAGHHIGLSGREMFTFNPELANDDAFDDGDEAFDSYSKDDEEEDDAQYFDLDINALGFTVNESEELSIKDTGNSEVPGTSKSATSAADSLEKSFKECRLGDNSNVS